jgi:predicted metal-binding membrane protein
MIRVGGTTASTHHSAGGVRSPPSAAALPRRDRVVIASCIGLVCVLAWAYLVYLHHQMSSVAAAATSMMEMGMRMDAPWRVSDAFFTFAMWTVMMVGMMTASAGPVLLLFAATQARRAEHGVPAAVLMFGLGYITLWVGFSVCATLVQWALHRAALLSPAVAAASPRLAGALLIAAGVYQLTPLKRACLTHCQTPLGFLMSHWQDGAGGAFRMGLRHGVYCLGCCWALMGVLFAVGVMNLAWVAVLTTFILVEKLGESGARVARVGGAVLIGLGVLFFL